MVVQAASVYCSIMDGEHKPIWRVFADWGSSFRRHPLATAVAFLSMLASGLFEHRFFGWLNDKIDEHGSVAVKEAFETVTEVARNPLGITGIIAILVLVVAFGHSYIFVAFGRNAGDRFARWAAVLAIIVIGMALMWPLSSGYEQITRIIGTFVICGLIGAGLNEAFIRISVAHAQTTGNSVNKVELLASALEALADVVAAGPIISAGVVGIGGAGGPGVVGIGGAGGPGVVGIGGSGPPATSAPLAAAICQAAEQVRDGSVSKSQVSTVLAQTVLSRASDLPAAMGRVNSALAASDLPN